MTDILCAVTLKDETFADLLAPMQELDVSSLKDDADAKPSQEEQEEDVEANARLAEVATIQEFIAAKKARIAANPHLEVEKAPVAKKKTSWPNGANGRPRKTFFKVPTNLNLLVEVVPAQLNAPSSRCIILMFRRLIQRRFTRALR